MMMGVLALTQRNTTVLVACCGPLEAWKRLSKKVEDDGVELDARALSIRRDPSGNRWRDFRAAVMRMIELSLCLDQRQPAEAAALEVAARRAQLAELKHREKRAGAMSTGNSVEDDSFLYMGTGRTRGRRPHSGGGGGHG